MSDSPPKRKMDWSKRAPHHNRPASGIPAKGASIHGSAGPHPIWQNRNGWKDVTSVACERNEKGHPMPLPKTVENQQKAERAFAKAYEIMEDPTTDKHTQLAAANSVQSRVWGSPIQPTVAADASILDLVNASMKPKDASSG